MLAVQVLQASFTKWSTLQRGGLMSDCLLSIAMRAYRARTQGQHDEYLRLRSTLNTLLDEQCRQAAARQQTADEMYCRHLGRRSQ